MNKIKIYIIGFMAIILGLSLVCEGLYAEEKDNEAADIQITRELIIGQAVKLFAKGYIAVTDIDRAKKVNITKLEKMDDQEFRSKYTAIYGDMKELPRNVKTDYGIDEKMDRSTAIRKVQSASKKDLYTIIDSIPDAFIAKHFENYLAENELDLKKKPSLQEIVLFWSNIRKKLDGE